MAEDLLKNVNEAYSNIQTMLIALNRKIESIDSKLSKKNRDRVIIMLIIGLFILAAFVGVLNEKISTLEELTKVK